MHFNTEDDQRVLGLMPPEHAQAAFLHAQTLDEAATLMLRRTLSYGLVWQRQGALKNLLKAETKMGRLMEMWWHGQDSVELVGDDGKTVSRIPALHKDSLDDAWDCINYLVFFIQCARAGNIDGDEHVAGLMQQERERLIDRIREVAGTLWSSSLPDLEVELHKIADVMESLDG